MKNPGAAATKIDPTLITRPANTKLGAGDRPELIREGEQLWKSTKLSTNWVACQTCHQGNAAFKPTFAKPYPNAAAMVSEKVGVKQVHLDEMIQVCMRFEELDSPVHNKGGRRSSTIRERALGSAN